MLLDVMRKNPPPGYDLTEDFCRRLIKAAPMHDLGKIAVDDEILRKPGRFEPWEYEKMKAHAAEGGRIVHEILKDTDDDADDKATDRTSNALKKAQPLNDNGDDALPDRPKT
jgi:hypothetical protein